MLYLVSGDVSNLLYINQLNQYRDVADEYLRYYFSGKLNIDNVLDGIFTDTLDKKTYDQYMVALTMADEMPYPKTFAEILPYFFALQVNYYHSIGETDGTIPNRYLAGRVGTTCNWNFREYSGYNTLNNFEIEYVKFAVNFDHFLNTIYFELPIVRVKKGLFNTKFRQKEVGFMLAPQMEAPGYFILESNIGVLKHKVTKFIYMNLFAEAQHRQGSYIFNSKEDLGRLVATEHTILIATMLQDQGYHFVGHFENEDGCDFWLDDDFLLNITCRYLPELMPENNRMTWQELRPNFYRLIFEHKFYVTYVIGNTINILCAS